MTITELFNKIEHTAGINDKLYIMQQNINDTIKLIYEDTYDSARKYGVHKFQITTAGRKTVDSNYSEFHTLLDRLCARELTGKAAIDAVVDCLGQFCDADQQILASVLNKKLTIGLSNASFVKLTGGKAKNFEVTLALHLDKVKGVNPFDGTWYASRKCDGIRCVAKIDKHNGAVDVNFISRQGKPITTLDNVKPGINWLVRNLADGVYYADGEGCIVDENGDEDFQAMIKEVKRKDHTIVNPCYQLFDFVTEDEFNGVVTSPNFDQRYSNMQALFNGNTFTTIKLLKQEVITNPADFARWEGYVSAGNWEGFMLRKNCPFEVGRTKNLLKVKKFDDAEYVVKSVEIDEMTTAEPGIGNVTYTGVKSLVIEHKGNTVNVGTGLSKEQRKAWYADPTQIIGKTICVKYFETTIAQDGKESLRFPVLKAVYDDGRDV